MKRWFNSERKLLVRGSSAAHKETTERRAIRALMLFGFFIFERVNAHS